MGTSVEQRNYLGTNVLFNTKYCVNSQNVAKYVGGMLDDSFLNTLPKLFNDYKDFTNSLHIYPFDVRKFVISQTTESNVYVGGKVISYGGSNVTGFLLEPVIQLKEAGSFTINRQFGNFLDFKPFTKIDIYLPFCGWVNIDNDIAYKCSVIKIKYSINFDTGMCNSYICGTINNVEYLLYTQEGQAGYNLPIGSTNSTDVTRNIISGVINAGVSAVGFAIGSPIAGARALAGTLNTFASTKHTASYGTQSRGVESDVTPLNAILRIERPIIVGSTQTEYKHLKGIPCNQLLSLSTLSGFTKVADIHLEGFSDATSQELEQIETLLKDGVIL